MANTKLSIAREIIIDRLLRDRCGYTVYEITKKVNASLEMDGFRKVTVNAIRFDLQNFKYLYKQKIHVERRGYCLYYMYEDENATIFNNALTAGELRHLHFALMSIRFVDPIQGSLTYLELSNRLSDMLHVDPANDPIVLYKKIPSESDQRRFKALYQHISDKKPAIITYKLNAEKPEQKILVHPYYILYDFPNYYLLCHDATNNVAAKIPISKILRLVSSPETKFIPNHDFPLQDFYTKHLSRG